MNCINHGSFPNEGACPVCNGTAVQMTSQRETAEKLVEPYTPGTHPKFYTRNEVINLITAALEQAERAGFDRGIEAAALLLDGYVQGELELVNSGDCTMSEIRPALKRIACQQRDIRCYRIQKDVKP